MRMMMARVQLRRLRGLAALGSVLLLASAAPAVDAQAGQSELVLLTTTTTQDSGMLTILVDAFEKRGYRVKTIVAGSGDILKQGARGEGDVLLTHSPQAEHAWMQEGNGTSRRLVMYNDFIIVGPPDDPAHVKGIAAAAALWLAFNLTKVSHRIAAALVMGLAVSSMHYVGMSAANMICTAAAPSILLKISGNDLGIWVFCIASAVLLYIFWVVSGRVIDNAEMQAST